MVTKHEPIILYWVQLLFYGARASIIGFVREIEKALQDLGELMPWGKHFEED